MSSSPNVSPQTRFWKLDGPFPLESGEVLKSVEVGFRTWGTLNSEGSNAVLVCHALTGSADVDDWWGGTLGTGRAFDPKRDFIVASNVLGGCYGTTGPASIPPGAPLPYGPDFPSITIRDMVRLQGAHLRSLGVTRLELVVGGSMGGMLAQEWAVMEPLPVESVAILGAPARHSAWAVGLGEAQRSAIRFDPTWEEGRYRRGQQPKQGLAVARMVAMCSYRSPESFDERFHRARRPDGAFQVQSYLHYQGEKLGDRFDANSYLTISEAMDSHDLSRGRGSLETVLAGITQPVLILGIPSDVLYTPAEVKALAEGLPEARLGWIDSSDGHDAFLIEQDQVNDAIRSFRQEDVDSAERNIKCA